MKLTLFSYKQVTLINKSPNRLSLNTEASSEMETDTNTIQHIIIFYFFL